MQPVPVLFYSDGFYLYPVYELERLTLIILIIISVQAITHALVTCRYAHQNRIREVGDLSHLTALNTLNISSNEVFDLKGLEGCVGLETLICTHNFLESVESITPLLQLSPASPAIYSSNITTYDGYTKKTTSPSSIEAHMI